MNSKKSTKRKYNRKTRNTRKKNKKGGVKFSKTVMKAIPKVVEPFFLNTKPINPGNVIPTKPINPGNVIPTNPVYNKYLVENAKKDIYNQIASEITKKGIDIQSNQQTGPTVDVKKALETPEPPSTKPDDKITASQARFDSLQSKKSLSTKHDDKVRFSELASEDWFSPVNVLTSKIKEGQKKAMRLLDLDELVDEYKKLGKGDEEEKEKILNKIKDTIYWLDAEDAKKYGINKNNTERGYVPDTSKIKENVKTLKQKSTFTYNLLKNIDISPREIQTAYCDKWTKQTICKGDDSPVVLIKNMFYYVYKENMRRVYHLSDDQVEEVLNAYNEGQKNKVVSLTEICITNDVPKEIVIKKIYEIITGNKPDSTLSKEEMIKDIKVSLPPTVCASVQQKPKSVEPSIFNNFVNFLPYTYVPGYNISINGVATLRTIYGALFGFDEKWLHYILGISDPIVNTVFKEIKNSEVDFTTLLLCSVTGKNEEDIEEYYDNHKNIKNLKDKLNEFLKRNADSFSEEYKTTHFVGSSEEFQEKIKNAVNEELKEEIETEYHNMADRLAKKILIIADGLKQFQKELLLFIISDGDFGNFNDVLEKNEKPIDVLEKEARLKLNIQ
jgi:hypothetical protein